MRCTSTPASSPGPAATPSGDAGRQAHQLRAARGGAGAAQGRGAPAHRGADARREPGPGLALRQAGARQHRRRPQGRCRQAQVARRLGRPGAAPGRARHPYRRARHAGLLDPEGARRVRQHLVGGRLRLRRLAAGRARLGLARAQLSARRQALRVRRRRGDLPHAARRGHARAQLGAARRPVPRIPDHARRGDIDRRLPQLERRSGRAVPADGALRVPSFGQRRALGARIRRAATTRCRRASAS